MNTINKIRIIIADDHTFFREGLRLILGLQSNFEIVAEVGDGNELVEAALQYKPDLLIVDIGMPNLNGIEAVKQLSAKGCTAKVIALSMHTEDAIIMQMLIAGAMGYLDKNISKEELFNAIDSVVIHNSVYFPESANAHIMELLSSSSYKPYPDKQIEFTERELEVILLVCSDFTNKEIANKLLISPRTVETHRVRIMERMNVKSVAGLVAYSFSNGLMPRT